MDMKNIEFKLKKTPLGVLSLQQDIFRNLFYFHNKEDLKYSFARSMMGIHLFDSEQFSEFFKQSKNNNTNDFFYENQIFIDIHTVKDFFSGMGITSNILYTAYETIIAKAHNKIDSLKEALPEIHPSHVFLTRPNEEIKNALDSLNLDKYSDHRFKRIKNLQAVSVNKNGNVLQFNVGDAPYPEVYSNPIDWQDDLFLIYFNLSSLITRASESELTKESSQWLKDFQTRFETMDASHALLNTKLTNFILHKSLEDKTQPYFIIKKMLKNLNDTWSQPLLELLKTLFYAQEKFQSNSGFKFLDDYEEKKSLSLNPTLGLISQGQRDRLKLSLEEQMDYACSWQPKTLNEVVKKILFLDTYSDHHWLNDIDGSQIILPKGNQYRGEAFDDLIKYIFKKQSPDDNDEIPYQNAIINFTNLMIRTLGAEMSVHLWLHTLTNPSNYHGKNNDRMSNILYQLLSNNYAFKEEIINKFKKSLVSMIKSLYQLPPEKPWLNLITEEIDKKNILFNANQINDARDSMSLSSWPTPKDVSVIENLLNTMDAVIIRNQLNKESKPQKIKQAKNRL